MANRYMAFGYEIIDGAVCIVEKEAEVVRNIYLLYIQGLSLQNISDRLNLLPIAYSDDGRPWNKNIVKRILENPKYTGDKGYPPFISEETAKLARECKEKKQVQLDEDDKSRLDAYRTKIKCGICGGKMLRMHANSGKNRRMYWKCSNKECKSNRMNFSEKTLNVLLADFMNELADDLDVIDIKTEKDYEKSADVVRANNEIALSIENPCCEIENVIEKIMNLASVKFEQCKAGDNTAITQKIKESLAIYPKKVMADGKTIEKIVRKIKILPNKEICIELINGKEFERREREIG